MESVALIKLNSCSRHIIEPTVGDELVIHDSIHVTFSHNFIVNWFQEHIFSELPEHGPMRESLEKGPPELANYGYLHKQYISLELRASFCSEQMNRNMSLLPNTPEFNKTNPYL